MLWSGNLKRSRPWSPHQSHCGHRGTQPLLERPGQVGMRFRAEMPLTYPLTSHWPPTDYPNWYPARRGAWELKSIESSGLLLMAAKAIGEHVAQPIRLMCLVSTIFPGTIDNTGMLAS